MKSLTLSQRTSFQVTQCEKWRFRPKPSLYRVWGPREKRHCYKSNSLAQSGNEMQVFQFHKYWVFSGYGPSPFLPITEPPLHIQGWVLATASIMGSSIMIWINGDLTQTALGELVLYSYFWIKRELFSFNLSRVERWGESVLVFLILVPDKTRSFH